MSIRRDGREAAVQYLYQLDVRNDWAVNLHAEFWMMRNLPLAVQEFCNELVAGVLAHRGECDDYIQRYALNFLLHRINAVDRNILRLGIYEMFHNLQVPPVVAIHEAIELARRFGGEDSAKFVNGILDKVKQEVKRPWREAAVPYRKPRKPAEPHPIVPGTDAAPQDFSPGSSAPAPAAEAPTTDEEPRF